MLPIYQGEDHQHLESIAGSALDEMDQNGMLRIAAVVYSNNSQALSANETQTLINYLNSVIPPGVGYTLTIGSGASAVNVTNSRGLLTSSDQVTKVEVISGPQEGWMGTSVL